MGMEGSEEKEGSEEGGVWEGNRNVDKGKGKEKLDDGNMDRNTDRKKDRKKDRNEGGSGNGRMDAETLQ